MTNPIAGDNFPAHGSSPGRAPDANPGHRNPPQTTETGSAVPADRPELSRAHQRLTQETGGVLEPAIASMQQARDLAAQLRVKITADAQAALQAHGQADERLFEVAMARPTI